MSTKIKRGNRGHSYKHNVFEMITTKRFFSTDRHSLLYYKKNHHKIVFLRKDLIFEGGTERHREKKIEKKASQRHL